LVTALSDLGFLAYKHYWSRTLARTILAIPPKRAITIADLRDETYIAAEDIIATLQGMNVMEQKKRGGAELVINKASVRAWAERGHVDLKEIIDVEAFTVKMSEDESEEDEEEVED
jgi:histone acetyltransferase HTATIP